jgi:hypothetical protein
MYILGDLDSYYSENDFRSDDIQEVYEKALEMSQEAEENSFGIWTNEGDDLVAIAHNGELFLKAVSQ